MAMMSSRQDGVGRLGAAVRLLRSATSRHVNPKQNDPERPAGGVARRFIGSRREQEALVGVRRVAVQPQLAGVSVLERRGGDRWWLKGPRDVSLLSLLGVPRRVATWRGLAAARGTRLMGRFQERGVALSPFLMFRYF